MLNEWGMKFLDLARVFASWSKIGTGVGAVARDTESRAVLATGYNGLPRGVRDLPERLERPARYLWGAHAEENVVANAARKILEGSTVTVTHLCCCTCARMLINSGVAVVEYGSGKTSMPQEQFDIALEMFQEAGVQLKELEPDAD